MIRLICSALVAGALVVVPAAISTYSCQALAEATDKAAKTDKGAKADKADTGKTTKAAKKKKRDLTAGQKSARERQRQCGQEWREAKKAGKIEKGQTWPKYWSACNARLKGKSA